MAKKRRGALLAAVLLALAVTFAGCTRNGPEPEHGGGSTEIDDAPPPPPPPELMSLLPPECFAVVRADLVQLRETPYYESLVASLREMGDELQEIPVDFFGILARTDEVVVGFSMTESQQTPDEDSGFYLLLRGRYLDGELESTVAAVAEARDGAEQTRTSIATRELGELSLLTVENMTFSGLGTHTWIATRPQGVEEIVRSLDAEAPGQGLLQSESFGMLASAVGFSQAPIAGVLAATERFREGLLQGMGQSVQQGGIEAALLRAFVGASARIDLDQGIQITGVVETTNALVAAAAVDLVEEAIAELTSEPALAALISGHDIQLEGRTARISVTAEAEALVALLGNVPALRELVEAFDDDGRGEPSPPPQGDSPNGGQSPDDQSSR